MKRWVDEGDSCLIETETDEETDETDGRNTETEDGDSDSQPTYIKIFTQKWGWISSVDEVANTTRLSWDDVFKKNVVEFLNILCYTKDKANMETQQQKEFMNKINKKKHYG